MEEFQQRQEQAEQTVSLLKEQLAVLKDLAVEKKKEYDQEEIRRLQSLNARLLDEITQLKTDLSFYEAQNGVKHISIPQQLQSPVVRTSNQDVAVEALESKHSIATETTTPVKKATKEKKKVQAPPERKLQIDVSRLLMKVGKIIAVDKHPDADTLYVEKVDVGEGKLRAICSGLVQHYQPQQLQDRLAIFMCNLKPVRMRGVLSEGMIMCATTPEKVELLEVPSGAAVGDRVVCSGFPGEADAQLNPKKKIWEQIKPDLLVNSVGVPGYKGDPFLIDGKQGTCSAPTLKDCPIT